MSGLANYPDTYDDDDVNPNAGCAAESDDDMTRGDEAERLLNALLGRCPGCGASVCRCHSTVTRSEAA